MKFLCVPCDSPMTLQSVGPPERGSLSVVYACPECGYEIAMLTNAYETQIVQSLGVRIGPSPEAGASTATVASTASAASMTSGTHTASGTRTGTGSGCPFSAMIPAAERASNGDIRWTAAAEARLENLPEFVRPMARTGIERFAKERGLVEVDEQILDAAREFFGM